MADDLDAFFDEVSEAEAKAKDETDQEPPAKKLKTSQEAPATDDKDSEPPAKRLKTTAPVRPRGVVVAAKAAASSSISNGVPPPPPPPPTAHSAIGPTVPAPPASGVSALPPLPAGPPPPPPMNQEKQQVSKPHIRRAAGKTWVDPALADWPDDFRLFVGNLSPEVNDAMLLQHFQAKYPSAQRARVVCEHDKNASSSGQPPQQMPPQQAGMMPMNNNMPFGFAKSKGYGFVSLTDALQCAKALREMDQSWLGSRPIRVKRSRWQDREVGNRHKGKKKGKRR